MVRQALFAALIALCPSLSWAEGPADQAFARGDYATARSIWLEQAEEGAADAILGLGLLADRGFGQNRDLGEAFDWYLKAAEMGLAEAQFNVAVMLDAGLGRPRDVVAAQVWYTRAALRGHARAQYNLALLFETGDGLAANPQMAQFWFDRAAADVPAAANRSLVSAANPADLATPEVLFSEQKNDSFEVVWSAASSLSATYLLEAVAIPDGEANYDAPVFIGFTTGSGLLDSLPAAPSSDLIWRVVNVSSESGDYAASDWIALGDGDAPDGRITLLYDPAIPAMADATAYFAETLRAAGFWVRNETRSSAELTGVYVGYGYAADAAFAQKVASFLPSGEGAAAISQLGGISQPGEIIIDLAAFR